MNPSLNPTHEWLEADGLGGFASGTATGIRTRRYHALLLVAVTPPTGRVVLVNGFDAWIETPAGRFPLTPQNYAPDVVTPGAEFVEAFESDPWPTWIFKFPDGTRISQEMFAAKEQEMTCVSWELLGPPRDVKLFVRPFLSGRDYHALHKANAAFCFDAQPGEDRVSWHPYADVPAVSALTNGKYRHEPLWYYNFRYEEESARGLDQQEDLGAPGVFEWKLGKAVLMFTTKDKAVSSLPAVVKPVELFNRLREQELQRRAQFISRLHRAADAYLVKRGNGKTIVAGYPWFTDWGRDTFVALRGLCLATGRVEEAGEILLAWSDAVSEGMLPNRFTDHGESPDFNSVDASLWFVVAAYEYLKLSKAKNGIRRRIIAAIDAIVSGYSKGTRYQIHADRDGLLSAGEPGVQLTWMDAKVGDWVVTPRSGKPVEVQALWLNALWILNQLTNKSGSELDRGLRSFDERFWNEERRFLYDVVDANHNSGAVDAALRPNQILAVGGLPLPLLSGERARLVVEVVEDNLLTPLGLRSLAPSEPGYCGRYSGGVRQRDGAYHQGTVWPWLLGPFVEAWVRVHGDSNQAKREARLRFLYPLLRHMGEAGLGHISEIADGDAPHTPRGCPFQAWSVGEALRLDRIVLAGSAAKPKRKRPERQLIASE